MAESPKSNSYTGFTKSPSKSYQSSSRTITSKNGQQYTPINREWATPKKPDSFQHHDQCENAETRTISEQVNAQYLSPMERWEREDLRQSQWNNIASYSVSLNIVNRVPIQKIEGQGDNWSMAGNAPSEK